MTERKIAEIINSFSKHGKSSLEVICPYCKERNTIYVWSYAGCGKRCEKCKKMLWIYEWMRGAKEPQEKVLSNSSPPVQTQSQSDCPMEDLI